MTLTPFALGARVQMQPWIRSPSIEGKLVKIGRKYLTVMLDSGEIINRLHPTSIIRPLRSLV